MVGFRHDLSTAGIAGMDDSGLPFRRKKIKTGIQ